MMASDWSRFQPRLMLQVNVSMTHRIINTSSHCGHKCWHYCTVFQPLMLDSRSLNAGMHFKPRATDRCCTPQVVFETMPFPSASRQCCACGPCIWTACRCASKIWTTHVKIWSRTAEKKCIKVRPFICLSAVVMREARASVRASANGGRLCSWEEKGVNFASHSQMDFWMKSKEGRKDLVFKTGAKRPWGCQFAPGDKWSKYFTWPTFRQLMLGIYIHFASTNT